MWLQIEKVIDRIKFCKNQTSLLGLQFCFQMDNPQAKLVLEWQLQAYSHGA
jgi:hypothetical protein